MKIYGLLYRFHYAFQNILVLCLCCLHTGTVNADCPEKYLIGARREVVRDETEALFLQIIITNKLVEVGAELLTRVKYIVVRRFIHEM